MEQSLVVAWPPTSSSSLAPEPPTVCLRVCPKGGTMSGQLLIFPAPLQLGGGRIAQCWPMTHNESVGVVYFPPLLPAFEQGIRM